MNWKEIKEVSEFYGGMPKFVAKALGCCTVVYLYLIFAIAFGG